MGGGRAGVHGVVAASRVALLLVAGLNGAAAQVVYGGQPRGLAVASGVPGGYASPGYGGYPGYGAVIPQSPAPPMVVFPPGLPEPRPFELAPAPSSASDRPRQCVAGSYVCPARGPGPVGSPCSCPAEEGRAEGRIR